MTNLDSTPIISSFQISGMHGYKNITLDFIGPARIVIAENGMGKTTILSAIQAFLSQQYSTLRKISFESIECHISSSNDPLVLRKEDLPLFIDSSAEEKLRELAKYTQIDSSEIQNIIVENDFEDFSDIRFHPVFEQIYVESPYSPDELVEHVVSIKSVLMQSRPENVQELSTKILDLMKAKEILYLPTYRRIERPLIQSFKRPFRHRPIHIGMSENERGKQLTDLDIQFALTDVDDKLKELFATIQRQSNLGYMSISANIIDDLLADDLREINISVKDNFPDIDALTRFFSRIDNSDSPNNRSVTIRELYDSGNINKEPHNMLRYFLSKLSDVVEKTKELETRIKEFVDKSNSYLRLSSDEKVLEYDQNDMKVVVRNSWTGAEINLNDLSSGEKQVISLLARLYLYPENKIVLIDEPELSLSIDWQKRLLPDLLSAPSCVQLLAITHSPFIFDNMLDPYAGPLKVEKSKLKE